MLKILAILSFLAARLREPSSAAGIAAVGVALGAPPELMSAATSIVVGVAGAAAVLLPEAR